MRLGFKEGRMCCQSVQRHCLADNENRSVCFLASDWLIAVKPSLLLDEIDSMARDHN